jgi:peptide/nickel transport system substrate-binding protein
MPRARTRVFTHLPRTFGLPVAFPPRYDASVRRALLALALLASACPASRPERTRPLELVIPQDLATLDPRFSTRGLDIKTTRLVHAGLVGLDPVTLAPIPLVARGWHFDDDETLEVELRPGVRFHSGRALSAHDVCDTLAALADPQLASPHRAVVEAIGACTVRDETHLTIHLAEPRATLLTDLEVPILRGDQAHLPPRPNGELDGLGPYRIAKSTPGALELEPADTGVLPRPAHALVIRTVHDENARALRLLAGRTDVAPNAISPALLPALAGRSGLAIHARTGADVTYLLFQNERAPFDRPEVRRAVARAIDRETIVRTLFAGRAHIASSMLPPGHWAAPPDAAPVPFDPESARGVLRGLPRVTLLTSTDRLRLIVARAIAQMLGDAGLEVRVQSLDLGVLLERLDAGDFDFATLQMPELTEPNVFRWFFHPRGVPGEGGEGKNRARWRDADVGRWLDRASATRDEAERKRLYALFAARLRRDQPVVPLWHEDQVAVVSPRAASFFPSAEGRWLALASVP